MSPDDLHWQPLPEGASPDDGTAHEGGVYGLVVTAGAVISGGGEGLLLVRERDGALRRPAIAMPNRAGVLCLARSPDGGSLVAGTMQGAALVDVAAGRVEPVTGPRGWVRSVDWAAPGWAAVGDDHYLWIARDGGAPMAAMDLGQQLHLVQLPDLDPPCALTRDAMRRTMLVPLDGGPPRWQRNDFEPDSVSVAALTGHRLALAGDVGPIRMLDVSTGSTLAEHTSPLPITAMAWAGDTLVTAHRDLSLRCFSTVGQWRCQAVWQTPHRSWINAIVARSGDATPCAELITGGDDGMVWRAQPT